jgi:hypothetical protein
MLKISKSYLNDEYIDVNNLIIQIEPDFTSNIDFKHVI